MHALTSKVGGLTCIFAAFLGGVVTAVENSEAAEAGADDRIPACVNFYRHVCPDRTRTSSAVTASSLKKELYEKLQGILDQIELGAAESQDPESESLDNNVNFKQVAKRLYTACVQDKHKSSKEDVKKALNQMLESIGITRWPVVKTSHESSVQILEKTGLRPFATIKPVPDKDNPYYIVAVNAPFPRFGAYPDTMKDIKKKPEKYKAYKNLVRSVLNIAFDLEDGAVGLRPEQSYEDDTEYYYSTSEEEYEEPEEYTRVEEVRSETAIVMNDILEVEIKLAEMICNARNLHYYETTTVQDWQRQFGSKFPFLSGLSTDFTKAKTTLANNYIIGVHLKYYFTELAKYLQTLDVRTVINYIGWSFVREVADVLTSNVREKLNAFLKTISKPGVAVHLGADRCVEKLIGYYPLMEEAVAHLYLRRFFSEQSMTEAFNVAQHINSSFYETIEKNTWMDDLTRERMKKWISGLQYHMGAPRNLLDEMYIKKQYDLVKLPKEESLLLYVFTVRENNFLRTLRLYKQDYDKHKIWPVSPLAVYGRYSEHYNSLEMPAGALQDSIFQYYARWSIIFGSMGTLTAEGLTGGFTDAGRLWLHRDGPYKWTEEAKGDFESRLRCLKIRKQQNPPLKNRGASAQARFDRKVDEQTLPMKLRDHVGLRTSLNAFKAITSECTSSCTALEVEGAKILLRSFFTSYAHRHCGPDGGKENEHRVNFALKMYTEFSLAFGCKDGDPMKKDDNCRIMTGGSDADGSSGQ